MEEELEWTWQWHPGRDSLVGFAQRGFRCPDTGTVYVGFRSNFDDVKPVIAAGTPTSGSLIYTWTPDIERPNPDDRARVRSVIVATPTQLIARGNVGANEGQEITAYIPPDGVLPDRDTGRIMGGTATVGSSMAVGTQASTDQSNSIAVGIRAKTEHASTTAVGALAFATGVHATAVGKSASANGPAVAVGSGASANVGGAVVAVGRGANAVGGESVVVGDLAVGGATSVVIGSGANAAAEYSSVVAIGRGATGSTSSVAVGRTAVSAFNSVSIGRDSHASGSETVVLGRSAYGAATSVIVGSGASSGSGTASTVVVGYQATSVTSGVAIGRGAKVDHMGSIALGRDTATTRSDQVAFGARHVEAAATTAPTTPAAGNYRTWSEVDDTTGKMRLMVAFPTGTPIVIAEEA